MAYLMAEREFRWLQHWSCFLRRLPGPYNENRRENRENTGVKKYCFPNTVYSINTNTKYCFLWNCLEFGWWVCWMSLEALDLQWLVHSAGRIVVFCRCVQYISHPMKGFLLFLLSWQFPNQVVILPESTDWPQEYKALASVAACSLGSH